MQNGMKKYPHDNILKLHMLVTFAMEGTFGSISLLLSGNIQELSKRINDFKDIEEFYLATVIAMANAHKMCAEIGEYFNSTTSCFR